MSYQSPSSYVPPPAAVVTYTKFNPVQHFFLPTHQPPSNAAVGPSVPDILKIKPCRDFSKVVW